VKRRDGGRVVRRLDADVKSLSYCCRRRRKSGRCSNYWCEAPHLQTLVFRVIADDAVAWNALLRGDIDVGRVSNETW